MFCNVVPQIRGPTLHARPDLFDALMLRVGLQESILCPNHSPVAFNNYGIFRLASDEPSELEWGRMDQLCSDLGLRFIIQSYPLLEKLEEKHLVISWAS